MTRQFLRRFLKLKAYAVYDRSRHFIRHHIPALSTVFILLAGLLYGVRFLPATPLHVLGAVSRPVTPTLMPLPAVSAQHIFIQDIDTGEVLSQVKADEELYPASTTKIVSGLVAMRQYALSQVITVTREYPEGQHVGFVPGEQLTVENLLYALLIDSANDAAEILAENYPGGRVGFVNAMNELAQVELGLHHTHFLNPHGLDEDGHYSSAADLGRLAGVAIKNPLFARIVGTETTVVSSIDHTQTHVLANTNELLGKVPGVLGIKTGFTDKAGQSLITLVRRGDRTLVFVVMGSADRFGDTRKLIDWAFPTE